jgi:hypothetical protein
LWECSLPTSLIGTQLWSTSVRSTPIHWRTLTGR